MVSRRAIEPEQVRVVAGEGKYPTGVSWIRVRPPGKCTAPANMLAIQGRQIRLCGLGTATRGCAEALEMVEVVRAAAMKKPDAGD